MLLVKQYIPMQNNCYVLIYLFFLCIYFIELESIQDKGDREGTPIQTLFHR